MKRDRSRHLSGWSLSAVLGYSGSGSGCTLGIGAGSRFGPFRLDFFIVAPIDISGEVGRLGVFCL